MRAKSITATSTEEIKTVLKQAMVDDYRPTLAFAFITQVADVDAIRAMLNAENIYIFGASTAQKFTEEGIETNDSIVLLLLDINPNYFRTILIDYSQSSPLEAARQVGQNGVQAFEDPAFIISAVDIRMSGEELIRGLADAAGNNVSIVGGVAGSPADFSGIVFTNDICSTKGILALVIDQDKVAMNGLAVSGWKPIGTEKKITKSDGSWVFSIDNEPAMDVIQKFLGKEVIADNDQPRGLIPSDLGYPLQFQKAPGSFLMMPLLMWNRENRSVMIGGQVKEGESFRFSLPPDFDVIDKVIESTQKVKEEAMPDVDALIVFSCIGRLGTFGPMISTEIEGLATTWNKPMIGFFSLGEFGKLENGPCQFHGTTVSWVALKEK